MSINPRGSSSSNRRDGGLISDSFMHLLYLFAVEIGDQSAACYASSTDNHQGREPMLYFPMKLRLPIVVFTLPFSYLIVSVEDYAPWLAALGVQFLLSLVVASHFELYAYRVNALSIWGCFLLVACAAFAVAPIYALIAIGNLDGLFVARHH
jgi:hypothetical protein